MLLFFKKSFLKAYINHITEKLKLFFNHENDFKTTDVDFIPRWRHPAQGYLYLHASWIFTSTSHHGQVLQVQRLRCLFDNPTCMGIANWTKPASLGGFTGSLSMGSCFDLPLLSKCHQHLISLPKPQSGTSSRFSVLSSIPCSIPGQPLAGLCSKHVLYPTICHAKYGPLLKVVSARFCLWKGNFSYLKLSKNLLSGTLKRCECLVSPAFCPTTLTSTCEPYLNQLLQWWLQNGNFSNGIISSISTLHWSVKNSPSCPLFENWYASRGYFIIQCAVVQYCHYSCVCSNCSKFGFRGQAIVCVRWTCPCHSCKTPLLSDTTELG